MQSKLSSFFPVVKKSCLPVLLYDATNGHTFFYKNEDEIEEHIFITTKCGIKLCLKENTKSKKVKFFNIHNIPKKHEISPLFKSNLQKSIRRGCLDDALQTMTWLWLNDPDELCRRLPIIFIEDVILLKPFSTVIWWMMAGKEYVTSYRRECDLIYMASFIEMLCMCNDYFIDEENDENNGNNGNSENNGNNGNDIPLDFSDSVEILCLHIRIMYGGTKSDMKMMANAYTHYKTKNKERNEGSKKGINDDIRKNNKNYVYDDLVRASLDNFNYIQDYGIDFHHYPGMLWKLQKQIKTEDNIYLDKDVIRMSIWHAESAVNFRKNESLEKSNEYKQKHEWALISDKLQIIREEIRDEIINKCL